MTTKLSQFDKTQELIDELESESAHASGPNKYVIRALKPLVKSNAKLGKAIESLENTNLQVVHAIDCFQESTIRTEKIMIGLVIAQILLAIVVWLSPR